MVIQKDVPIPVTNMENPQSTDILVEVISMAANPSMSKLRTWMILTC